MEYRNTKQGIWKSYGNINNMEIILKQDMSKQNMFCVNSLLQQFINKTYRKTFFLIRLL